MSCHRPLAARTDAPERAACSSESETRDAVPRLTPSTLAHPPDSLLETQKLSIRVRRLLLLRPAPRERSEHAEPFARSSTILRSTSRAMAVRWVEQHVSGSIAHRQQGSRAEQERARELTDLFARRMGKERVDYASAAEESGAESEQAVVKKGEGGKGESAWPFGRRENR